ncbi:MAG: hypothetical protein V1936_00490 [Patescibacteria group bacterium]
MGVDTSYLSEEAKQALGENLNRRMIIESEHPTKIVRPGDRTEPGSTGLDTNKPVFLGIIQKNGSHETQTPPEFLKTFPVAIVRILVNKILEIEDFSGFGSDIQSAETLIEYLCEKYPNREFTRESVVTVYELEPY